MKLVTGGLYYIECRFGGKPLLTSPRGNAKTLAYIYGQHLAIVIDCEPYSKHGCWARVLIAKGAGWLTINSPEECDEVP